MGCPFGCAVLPCNFDFPVVCPVHHVIRGNNTQAADIVKIIINYLAILVILVIIGCHIDINAPVIYNRIGIGAKFLGHQRVAVAQFFGQRPCVKVFQVNGGHAVCNIVFHSAIIHRNIVGLQAGGIIFVHIAFQF